MTLSVSFAAAPLLAAVYAVASIGKARDRTGFREYLRHLMGRASIVVVWMTLGLEASLAFSLVGSSIYAPLAAFAGAGSALLLLAGTGVHAAMLSRGGGGACHCFGRISAESERLDSSWRPALIAARNAALVALSLAVAGTSLQLGVITTSLPLALIMAGLLGSIRHERALLRLARHPSTEAFPAVRMLQAHTWWVDGHPRDF